MVASLSEIASALINCWGGFLPANGSSLSLFTSSTPSPVPAPTPMPNSAPRASAGCSKTPLARGQYKLNSTDGQGRVRSYQIVVPADYTGRAPLILAFAFHGAGGNGQDALNWEIQETKEAKSGAIFVAPDGIPFLNYGVGWNDSYGGYDIPLFDRMVAEIEDKYCIDTSRVVAYGFSWGGDFASALLSVAETACGGLRLTRHPMNSAIRPTISPTGTLRTGRAPCSQRPRYALPMPKTMMAATPLRCSRPQVSCSSLFKVVRPTPFPPGRGCACRTKVAGPHSLNVPIPDTSTLCLQTLPRTFGILSVNRSRMVRLYFLARKATHAAASCRRLAENNLKKSATSSRAMVVYFSTIAAIKNK
jgi:hypothetical protein